MKILLTGATGYLGAHLLKKLIYENNKITVISRKKIDWCNLEEIILSDLENFAYIEKKLKNKNFDLCIHVAWLGTYGQDRNNNNLQLKNLVIIENLVQLCKKLKCKKIISFGSIAEIESFINLHHSYQTNITLYSLSKYYLNGYFRYLCNKENIDWNWIVITNIYGKCNNNQRLINKVILDSLNNIPMKFGACNYLYDFIYIDDAVNAIWEIIKKGKSNKQYLLGSGKPKILKTFIEQIIKKINKKANRNYSNINQNYNQKIDKSFFNNLSVYQDTGYRNKISFLKGIEKEINYLRDKNVQN